MPSIFDVFASQLDDQRLDQIAQQIGADRNQTRDAISMTLPALVEALGRKVEKEGGADDLHQRLSQVQAPASTSEVFDEILPPTTAPHRSAPSPAAAQRPAAPAAPARPAAPPAQRPAGGSAMDVFGDLLGGSQRGRVADVVSKTSGLQKEQAGSLISMLGPLLSGVLSQETKTKQMNADDLGGMIRQDRAKVQKSASGGLLGRMLDQDGDGDFDISDIMKLGASMLFRR